MACKGLYGPALGMRQPSVMEPKIVANTTQDLTASMWRDDEWLKFYPLNVHTAIDYFSLSPFYSMDCNNEKAKLKGMPPSAIP